MGGEGTGKGRGSRRVRGGDEGRGRGRAADCAVRLGSPRRRAWDGGREGPLLPIFSSSSPLSSPAPSLRRHDVRPFPQPGSERVGGPSTSALGLHCPLIGRAPSEQGNPGTVSHPPEANCQRTGRGAGAKIGTEHTNTAWEARTPGSALSRKATSTARTKGPAEQLSGPRRPAKAELVPDPKTLDDHGSQKKGGLVATFRAPRMSNLQS